MPARKRTDVERLRRQVDMQYGVIFSVMGAQVGGFWGALMAGCGLLTVLVVFLDLDDRVAARRRDRA